MSPTGGVMRFMPDGPSETGLIEWERIDPEKLLAGKPVQRGHIYHEDPDLGYLVGVWDCTAQTEHPGPYAVDEFMYLLEGTIIMGLPDGSEITVSAGEAFVIPKGFRCQWKQPNYVRKFFMILDRPIANGAANPSLTRISLPELKGPVIQPEGKPSDAVLETVQKYFVNADGSMEVVVRDCTEMTVPCARACRTRLVHVLAGAVTVTANGEAETFNTGDTFYIPKGISHTWQTATGTRLLEASFMPD